MESWPFRGVVAGALVVLVVTASVASVTTASRRPTADGDAVESASQPSLVGPTSQQSVEAQLRDGETFYVGQVLVTDAYQADATVDVERANGSLVSMAFVHSNGTLRLQTAGLAPGDYAVVGDGGTTTSFRLVEQTLRVSANRSTAPRAGGDPAVAVDVVSNRRQYDYAVTSPDLSAEELNGSVFASVPAADRAVSGGRLVLTGDASHTLTANFSGLSPGTYDLQFGVLDTTASAGTSVRVTRRPTGQVTVAAPAKVVQIDVGTVARIPLSFSNAHRASIAVGSRATGWKTVVNVTDADRDGAATVLVDTANVHRGRTVFQATGADSITDVTVDVAPSRRIAATTYPMNVRTGGRVTDVATLSLQRPDTLVCSRNVDPLVDEYNRSVGDVPWFLNGLVRQSTIEVTVDGASPGTYTLVTDGDRHITRVREGAPSNPSVTAETDCDTLESIADAENASAAFGTAYERGDVRVRGRGPVNGFLVEAVKLANGIANWLRGF